MSRSAGKLRHCDSEVSHIHIPIPSDSCSSRHVCCWVRGMMASVRPAAHSADRDYLAQGPIRRSRLDLSAGNSARIGAHGPNGSPYSKNFFKCEIVHTSPADT
jgi:hypothetical protein